ncbi:MAG: transporter substrate-binding protein [Haloplasmataceae bacterium]|nr:transporter substrate-binding protein [Haloplasmataceae bacterium]
MKKYFLLFLSVVFTLGLAACGKKTTDTSSTVPINLGVNEFFQNKDVEEWKAEYTEYIDIDSNGNGTPDWQETEMTIVWAGPAMFDKTDENMIQRLGEDWAKKYPNITVERDERFLGSAGDAWTQLDMMVAASQDGSMPDLFFSLIVAEYYNQGLTLDITPYLRTDPDARWISNNALTYMTSFDGKEMTGSVYAYYPSFIGVNTGLLEELNVAIPNTHWTYEEYEATRTAVGTITESSNKCQFPGAGDFLHTGANYFDNMPGGYGGFNLETKRFEFEKAPKWGEWQEQWVSEIDRGWHMWDLTEARRKELCNDRTWGWGDGFEAVAPLDMWSLNMDPQVLKTLRGMEYEVYPIPVAPEGGNTQTFGWMDTFSMSYELAEDRVRAEAVYDLLKYISHGIEGRTTLYSYLQADVEKYGFSADEYVAKGGNAEDFPTVIYPGNVMMDYTFGWPTSTNPELIAKHPFVVGFPEDNKLNAYNFSIFKDTYFQQQLSNGETRVHRELPGLDRSFGQWVYWEMLQDMRDEGYSWNDLAPAMTERMNTILDGYLEYYNN